MEIAVPNTTARTVTPGTAETQEVTEVRLSGYLMPRCFDGWLKLTTHESLLVRDDDYPCASSGYVTAEAGANTVYIVYDVDEADDPYVSVQINEEEPVEYPSCTHVDLDARCPRPRE